MPRRRPTTDNNQLSHYGFQSFNLVRRITRELFVNGYRGYKEYIDINQSTYYNRLSLIYNCLSSFMEWPINGYRFISYNKMRITSNPLYELFKTRPMKTLFQYSLHYSLIDLLGDYGEWGLADIIKGLSYCYEITDDIEQKNNLFSRLNNYYIANGLIKKTDNQKYRLSQYTLPFITDTGDSHQSGLSYAFYNAISFYTLYSPVGVIGSFIMDTYEIENKCFSFKHAFLSQALDTQVIRLLLDSINNKKPVKLNVEQTSNTVNDVCCFLPIKILSSGISSRQYVFGYDYKQKSFRSFRIDYIEKVSKLDYSSNEIKLLDDKNNYLSMEAESFLSHSWGCVPKPWFYHVTITFVFKKEYQYNQLVKEKRNGKLSLIDSNKVLYECDIFDPKEMITWLLSHLGMVSSIIVSGGKTTSDNNKLIKRFKKHVKNLFTMYKYGRHPKTTVKRRYVPLEKNKSMALNRGGDDYDVFDPVYSTFVNQIDIILKTTTIPKTKSEICEIIKTNSKGGGLDTNSVLSFETMLDAKMFRECGSIKEEPIYSSYLVHGLEYTVGNIHRPLTALEVSWVKSILYDEKIKMFLDENDLNVLKKKLLDVPILYSAKDIKYFDQYYTDKSYLSKHNIANFRILMSAINQGKRNVRIKYRTNSEKAVDNNGHFYIITPLKIEYSRLSDSFWLQGVLVKASHNAPVVRRESSLVTLRIDNIDSVEFTKDTNSENLIPEYETLLEKELTDTPIELQLNDFGNSFERFMVEFSPYKKETVFDPKENICKIKIWYAKIDKKDIFLRLRGFGCAVQIMSPKKLRLDMIKMIHEQMNLIPCK